MNIDDNFKTRLRVSKCNITLGSKQQTWHLALHKFAKIATLNVAIPRKSSLRLVMILTLHLTFNSLPSAKAQEKHRRLSKTREASTSALPFLFLHVQLVRIFCFFLNFPSIFTLFLRHSDIYIFYVYFYFMNNYHAFISFRTVSQRAVLTASILYFTSISNSRLLNSYDSCRYSKFTF